MIESLQGLFGGSQGQGGGDRAERQAARQERRAERQQWRSMRDDPAAMQRGQDFYQRYTSGSNTQGYDPREAYEMYRRVGQEATPQQMQTALQQTVHNMTPQQRAEFGQMLQQRQQGTGTVTMPSGQAGGDPGTGGLLGMIGNLFHGGSQDHPAPPTDHEGFLTHLFGGGQPAPAPASSRDAADQGSLFPGALDNPLAKVLIGGIAAYGAKRARFLARGGGWSTRRSSCHDAIPLHHARSNMSTWPGAISLALRCLAPTCATPRSRTPSWPRPISLGPI